MCKEHNSDTYCRGNVLSFNIFQVLNNVKQFTTNEQQHIYCLSKRNRINTGMAWNYKTVHYKEKYYHTVETSFGICKESRTEWNLLHENLRQSIIPNMVRHEVCCNVKPTPGNSHTRACRCRANRWAIINWIISIDSNTWNHLLFANITIRFKILIPEKQLWVKY